MQYLYKISHIYMTILSMLLFTISSSKMMLVRKVMDVYEQ